MDFKLKTIGSFVSAEHVIYPFDMQSFGDLIVHRSKESCGVLSMCNYQNTTPHRLQLSCSKTSKPKEYIHLNINKLKVFQNASVNEKHYMMLHPYLLPDCTLKSTHYLKSEISTSTDQIEYVLACLTTAGLIELYNYNTRSCELEQIDVNLSEIRKNALQTNKKEIKKFKVLLSSFNELAFANFEWCAVPFENFKLLLCITKSDELLFYQIKSDDATELKSLKIEDISKSKIKWMNMNDKYFLLVTTPKGGLMRYTVDLGPNGEVKNIEKDKVIEGKSKIPVSYVAVDFAPTFALIICCKGHMLEIFQMTQDAITLIDSKHISIKITGFEICDHLEYLITTLDSKIYYMKLTATNATAYINTFEKLEISSSEDLESSTNYHAFYGIATSRNNVLAFLSCYPQQAYDHLVNKQPNHISINLFTKYDPIQILMNNPTLKLTDYVDCVEAVRYIGMGKFEMLQDLEKMDYDISISKEFLYYLKIQLLIIKIKLVYYQMKSRNIYDIIKEIKDLIEELIIVINAHMLLKVILKTQTLTTTHYTVMRSIRKVIKNYCMTSVEKEPFKKALEMLEPELMACVKASDEMLKAHTLPAEICTFCQEAIDEDSLECASNHKVKRCVVTRLLVPLDCNNYCIQCKESVSSLEKLSLIIEEETADILFCPLCDLKLILNE